MENNEKALSSEQEVLEAQQEPSEEKEELSEIDKVKALFEYEMTQVLLSFKNEAKNLKGKDVSEYLAMKVPDAEVEYSAPEAQVKGIDYQETAGAELPEMKAQELPVSVSVSVPGAEKVRLAFSSEVKTDVSVNVPESAKVSLPGMEQCSEPSSYVEVPEVTSVSSFEMTTPVVKDAAVPQYPGIKAGAVPGIPGAEVGDISVSVPETNKTELPEIAAAGDVKAAVAVPAAEISSGFALSEPETGKISIAVPEAVMPEIPSVAAFLPAVPEYPAIPDKPDFSAYYSDIIDAVRAEL